VLKGQASLREMTTAAQEQRAPDLTKLSGEHLRGYLQSLGLVQGGEPISEEQMKAFQRIFAKYD
jgi:hypothetical protein